MMPTENFMYSVLNGTDLPEEKGYRYHSTIPSQAAEISATEIATNMETWLEDWNAAMVDA
jgi:ABC-type thiamine transport system substrate-binding protein